MNSGANSHDVRVLVVDDSAFTCTVLTRLIESDPSLKVVATAQDGLEALQKVVATQPDVVTLDVEMPRLNGLETLKRIMAECPRPVLMISSVTQEGAEITFEALALGAFDYIPKQMSKVSLDSLSIQNELVMQIKAAAMAGRAQAGSARAIHRGVERVGAATHSCARPFHCFNWHFHGRSACASGHPSALTR
jgi:two-component system, chemotaxis family, protein-glutamate methylesterase/glutaminase